MNIVRVALAVPLPRFFDYLYSPDLTPIVGGRVLVPFGSQKRVGIVVDLPASSDVAKEKLKPIIDVLDADSLFNSTIWDWLAWSANYYRAALGDVLFQACQSNFVMEKVRLKMTALFGVLRTLENKR